MIGQKWKFYILIDSFHRAETEYIMLYVDKNIFSTAIRAKSG